MMRSLQLILAWMACTGMLCTPVVAQQPKFGFFSNKKSVQPKWLFPKGTPRGEVATQLARLSTLDIGLGEGGSLVGEIRDGDGKPVSSAVVSVEWKRTGATREL